MGGVGYRCDILFDSAAFAKGGECDGGTAVWVAVALGVGADAVCVAQRLSTGVRTGCTSHWRNTDGGEGCYGDCVAGGADIGDFGWICDPCLVAGLAPLARLVGCVGCDGGDDVALDCLQDVASAGGGVQ